jgi:hypothetical protein
MRILVAMAVLVAASATAEAEVGMRVLDKAPSTTERKAMERAITRCFQALPAPARTFRRDRESDLLEIAGLGAEATRVYERRVTKGSDEDPVVLEVRVYMNREQSLPEPLGSEGGAFQPFRHDGLPAMRVFLAGVDPGGRVALPLTPEESTDALTVVRLHVGPPSAEKYLYEIAEGRHPDRTPWDDAGPRSLTEVRTIVVEYRGPRAEVERLLQATVASKLRAILDPS